MNSGYMVPFDSVELPQIETEILVIGSGNAGLRAAIEASELCDVLVVTKDVVRESNTRYAQGGIAVAMSEEDTVEAHVEDTINAGDGLCDAASIRVMVSEGIQRVRELMEWGANFDREDGELGFSLEAAHGHRRIIHARGDATGEETQEVLTTTAIESERIDILEHTFVVDLLTHEGMCHGALVLDSEGLKCIRAQAVILAAGGLGQLYRYTSNPEVATGDGLAIAYRAGCRLMDMEFVQFHPTTLLLDGCPSFLISEAVRGEGGILINAKGEIFMSEYHEKAELAPRDIVTRAIHQELLRTNTPYVYLDVTRLPAEFVRKRFPTITETCLDCGLDITDTLIPVCPSAHFMMGGVQTSLQTETNIQGIYACGEVACTRVHGANRLASNSLLEGLVFGARAGRCATQYIRTHPKREFPRFRSDRKLRPMTDAAEKHELIRDLMWEYVGITRDGQSLKAAASYLAEMECPPDPITRSHCELENMRQVALLIAQAALKRQESRGAHYRKDYPKRDDRQWQQHIVLDRDNFRLEAWNPISD